MATYKVLSFDELTGQLTVEFAKGMAPLSIDAPIENGLYLTGEPLDAYIQGFIPTWHLDRQTIINNGVPNKDELNQLVAQSSGVELPTALTEEQQQAEENKKMWSEVAFEKNVVKVLVKFGVLESDPTVIPVQQVG